MSASKTLVLLGVYVEDAVATARDYEKRLSMRRIAEHFVRTESVTSECIIMAGSDEPPWVVIFSGQGKESIAARVIAERGIGLHRLVYLTAEYDRDRAWLRKRDLGHDGIVPLANRRSIRRVSAPLSELGVIVDLIESPAPGHSLIAFDAPPNAPGAAGTSGTGSITSTSITSTNITSTSITSTSITRLWLEPVLRSLGCDGYDS